MATSVTFNGTSYSVPSSGETGWSSLSSFLIDVGNNAQSTAAQKGTIRIATSTPVTVSSTDYTVLSDLTVPGAVAVTLPAGVDKTIYVIGDANGDAQTYNITITPASGLINDAATYVIKNNYGVVALQYSSAATMWKVIGRYFTKIDAANEVYGILGAANGGTGIANNAAATLTRSGNHALTLTTTGTTGLTLPTTGTVTVTADKLSVFAATTSAELAGVISNETGSGLLVFNDTPTLIAPVLGAATGTSLLLSGLTASRAMVTDGSKNLASSAVTATELGYLSGVTSPTGSGALVLANTPNLSTPVLGVATATSINKVALTAPATGSTLTLADGKTLTVSNTLTFTGTDASSVAFGAGGTVTYTSNNLSVFASTTSAQLAGVLSDETGSGALVFANTPTLVTPVLGAATGTSLQLSGLTASTALATDGSKNIISSATTSTELGYVSGVTSAIQTQLNGKASVASAQDAPVSAQNYTLACSVSGNALTIALKSKSLTDPTGGDPVSISFRNATIATGDYAVVTATAATSVVVSSGSTLGHVSAVASYFYVYAINNAGTIELAVSTKLFDEGTVQTSTAEGGAGAADTSTVLYSTTARTSKAIRLLARLISTQTTAGTWAAVPTEISLGSKWINGDSVLGVTDGSTATAGYLGESFTDSSSTTYTGSLANITSRTLQPGTWRISAIANFDAASGVYAALSISTTSATTETTNRVSTPIVSGSGNLSSLYTMIRVNISVATTYYVVGFGNTGLGGSSTTRLICERVR